MSEKVRSDYVSRLAAEIRAKHATKWDTVYFGGGTPVLCDLRPVFDVLHDGALAPDAEFTVELHPADVTPTLLDVLAAGGVNRIIEGLHP